MIDFHIHSNASDGALSASEVLARAAQEGLRCLALTDHDTMAGYQSVKDVEYPGLRLISGVELSSQWGRVGVHVVATVIHIRRLSSRLSNTNVTSSTATLLNIKTAVAL